MFNYELVIKDSKGGLVTTFQLDQGASKKGTYITLSGKEGNKTIPFGKLYVDESKVINSGGKKDKASPVATIQVAVNGKRQS